VGRSGVGKAHVCMFPNPGDVKNSDCSQLKLTPAVKRVRRPIVRNLELNSCVRSGVRTGRGHQALRRHLAYRCSRSFQRSRNVPHAAEFAASRNPKRNSCGVILASSAEAAMNMAWRRRGAC
jgi:hypothetical protein